jgi:epoxyqueuosine reductase QueG
MLVLGLSVLYRELDELGFYSYGALTREEILAVAGLCGLSDEDRARYRIEEAQSAVVVALRYGEGLYEMPTWARPYCLGMGLPANSVSQVPQAQIAPRHVPMVPQAPIVPEAPMMVVRAPMVEGAPMARGSPMVARVPMVRIAHFARANWYAETLDRLKKLSQRLRKVLEGQAAASGEAVPPMRLWQRVVNSGLPERALALAAGLGSQGKNQILIARRKNTTYASDTSRDAAAAPMYSSAVVLGVLLCPVAFRDDTVCGDSEPETSWATGERLSPTDGKNAGGKNADGKNVNDKEVSGKVEKALAERGTYPLCGRCRKCLDACPSHALSLASTPSSSTLSSVSSNERGSVAFERLKCIQHWTARLDNLPQEVEKVLPPRLYGCDSCLEVCPYFRPDPKADTEFGRLGRELPARYFVESSNETIRENFRGTTMNLAWMSMDAFRRNAAWRLADRPD